MAKQEIFEDEPHLWRVNSAPFKARRLKLGLSLKSCAAKLSGYCGVTITVSRLWRYEKCSHFKVDYAMKCAIRVVLKLEEYS